MNEQPLVSKPLPEGRNYPSPVTHVLALGYYDGPTEGLMRCGAEGPTFVFRILAWEADTQDLRIFSLAPLPAAAWAQLVEAYSLLEKPRWPVWVPSWYEEMKQPVETALRQASPPESVIATDDLLGEILAAKAVTPKNLTEVADWGSFLGLNKELANRVLLSAENLFGSEQ
jgi:hypothetical protein